MRHPEMCRPLFAKEIVMSEYHELAEKLNGITDAALENELDEAEEMRLFEELLAEFKGDLDKQCVVLMGMPAAGKSTFINNGGITKYVPGFKSGNYRVVNSDVQLARIQYRSAEMDFQRLSRVKSDDEWKRVLKDLEFPDNSGRIRKIPFTWDEFKKIKNLNDYYKQAYKPYYSVYFDLRSYAKEFDKQIFMDKVKKSANILVIDTVAAKPSSLLKRLNKTKEEGFQNSIFFLDIDPNLCIVRDKYRGETEGRTVGEGVILGYAKNMMKAFNSYKSECGKKDGLVDRLYHFKWNPAGDSPIKGSWSLEKQYKCDVQRQLANLKDKTMAQGEDTEAGCGCEG